MTRLKQRTGLLMAAGSYAIVVIALLLIMANTPMHRADNYYIDQANEVTNRDVDILSIRSAAVDDVFLLELHVAGVIADGNLYEMTLLGLDAEGHQFAYRYSYENGSSSHDAVAMSVTGGDTIHMNVPKALLDEGVFFADIEAYAYAPARDGAAAQWDFSPDLGTVNEDALPRVLMI